MNSTLPTSIPRRHDLDALRAIAMLLGIGLHAALAYIPMTAEGWPVQDKYQQAGFGIFTAMVHGFRMPLFFLISGFFTAMLWRKRGLYALFWQRFKRIFLPLVLGFFTFVPAVWIVSIVAGVTAGNRAASITNSDPSTSLAVAARLGDLAAIREHVHNGAELNALDQNGTSPLSLAVVFGQVEAIDVLLELGADVNRRNRDGATPLHSAIFVGDPAATQALLAAGARTDVKNQSGSTPADLIQLDWRLTKFIAGLIQLDLDEAELKAGRQQCASLLNEYDRDEGLPREVIASDHPSEVPAKTEEQEYAVAPLGGLTMLLFLFPVFHHLWFLYFLCWLVLGFMVYAKIAESRTWRGAPQGAVLSWARCLWLFPLTILPQSFMGLLYPVFGPDTSAGLLPMPHVMLYYAIFFGFGVLYFDCPDPTGRVGGWWWLTLPLGLLVLFPVGYELTMGEFGLRDQWVTAKFQRPLSVAFQVAYTWSVTFGCMGFFRRFLAGESRATRYLSDSSYWLYLAHLPLVILAQMLLRNVELPALTKFAIVCTVVSGVLLLSYQWCVRYTLIGTLLNGPRKRPLPPIEAELVSAV